jgi:hypothetical protein
VDVFGYGMFRHEGRAHKATHVALHLSGIDRPRGNVVCHRCDNPPCVNPEHLYVGTQRDNARDRTVRERDGGPLRRGEGNGRAVLTWELVREIRAKWTLNVPGRKPVHTKRSLSREYGVSDNQIGYILSGRQWRE